MHLAFMYNLQIEEIEVSQGIIIRENGKVKKGPGRVLAISVIFYDIIIISLFIFNVA